MLQNSLPEPLPPRLYSVAGWRRRKAVQFQDDPRNDDAAARLEALARAPLETVDPNLWRAFTPYSQRPLVVRDAINEAAREIGFRRFPDNLNQFLSDVISKLPN